MIHYLRLRLMFLKIPLNKVSATVSLFWQIFKHVQLVNNPLCTLRWNRIYLTIFFFSELAAFYLRYISSFKFPSACSQGSELSSSSFTLSTGSKDKRGVYKNVYTYTCGTKSRRTLFSTSACALVLLCSWLAKSWPGEMVLTVPVQVWTRFHHETVPVHAHAHCFCGNQKHQNRFLWACPPCTLTCRLYWFIHSGFVLTMLSHNFTIMRDRLMGVKGCFFYVCQQPHLTFSWGSAHFSSSFMFALLLFHYLPPLPKLLP